MTDREILLMLEKEICKQAQAGQERLDMTRWLACSPWGRRQTERRFREWFLTSPARYFRDCQSDRAEALLTEGRDVLSASTESGFTSPGRLHDALVARRGMTPGEIRSKGAGVTIHFGFFETQVGVVLMAATKRGLCSLRLCGAMPEVAIYDERIAELKRDYCEAELIESTEHVQHYADQLVAFLEARADSFRPALDILHGTTFQREVWAELQKVEPGETISYSELARRIGKPTAVRAVAQACGSNNLAIAVPCHRVLRKDGSLAGFRWGIEWKQHLLQLEAEMTKSAV